MSPHNEKRLLQSASEAFRNAMHETLHHHNIDFILKAEGNKLYKIDKTGHRTFIKHITDTVHISKKEIELRLS